MRATYSAESQQILHGRVVREKIYDVERHVSQRCGSATPGSDTRGKCLSIVTLNLHFGIKQ